MNKFRYLSYLPLLCSAVWMQSGYAQGLGKPSSQGQGGNAQQQQVAPANQAPVVNVLPAAGENGYKIGQTSHNPEDGEPANPQVLGM
jgi:hypothetical protein